MFPDVAWRRKTRIDMYCYGSEIPSVVHRSSTVVKSALQGPSSSHLHLCEAIQACVTHYDQNSLVSVTERGQYECRW